MSSNRNLILTDKNLLTFRLWHMFALVTFVAAWIMFFQWNRHVGIVFSVSVVPALITLFLMRRVRNRKYSNFSRLQTGMMFLALVLVWFVLYVLSYGPFLAYWDSLGMRQQEINSWWVLYDPVDWLFMGTCFEGPLEWYVGFWSEPGEAVGGIR